MKRCPYVRGSIHVPFRFAGQDGGMFDVSRIPLFALADRRLAWLDRRQQVLAQNIANADTPGWRARDLRPFAALLAAPPLRLAASEGMPADGGPAGPAGPAAAAPGDVAQRSELAPDGNGVVLDRELMKVADSDMAHGLTVAIIRTWLGMFRTAIGR
jgi:flagellar basal-body rod protein FlgB